MPGLAMLGLAMLSVDRVSYAINGQALLREISFDLTPGEVLAVVGPNGAGKSTLLNTIVGDLSPSSGHIMLDELPLRAWTPLDLAKRRALLPQTSTLSFPFTVYEVALMGRNPHDTSNARNAQISQDALARNGMLHFAHREYPSLSGGERQRVQLARVLSQVWELPETGSRYLFLDEPTNNLDLAHQHHSLQVAKQFAAEGTGVLAVLHDLNLAAQYADRVLILCAGRVVALGTANEVMTTEILCPAFDLPVMVMKHPCLNCPLIVSAFGEAAQVDAGIAEMRQPQAEVAT